MSAYSTDRHLGVDGAAYESVPFRTWSVWVSIFCGTPSTWRPEAVEAPLRIGPPALPVQPVLQSKLLAKSGSPAPLYRG